MDPKEVASRTARFRSEYMHAVNRSGIQVGLAMPDKTETPILPVVCCADSEFDGALATECALPRDAPAPPSPAEIGEDEGVKTEMNGQSATWQADVGDVVENDVVDDGLDASHTTPITGNKAKGETAGCRWAHAVVKWDPLSG